MLISLHRREGDKRKDDRYRIMNVERDFCVSDFGITLQFVELDHPNCFPFPHLQIALANVHNITKKLIYTK